MRRKKRSIRRIAFYSISGSVYAEKTLDVGSFVVAY